MINSKSENQIRHEELIDFLSQFAQYSTKDGKPILKKIKAIRTSNKAHKISHTEINLAVIVFTDVLNLGGGSIGNIDLYSLLQAYLTIPEYRVKINDLIKEAQSFDFHRKGKSSK